MAINSMRTVWNHPLFIFANRKVGVGTIFDDRVAFWRIAEIDSSTDIVNGAIVLDSAVVGYGAPVVDGASVCEGSTGPVVDRSDVGDAAVDIVGDGAEVFNFAVVGDGAVVVNGAEVG